MSIIFVFNVLESQPCLNSEMNKKDCDEKNKRNKYGTTVFLNKAISFYIFISRVTNKDFKHFFSNPQ